MVCQQTEFVPGGRRRIGVDLGSCAFRWAKAEVSPGNNSTITADNTAGQRGMTPGILTGSIKPQTGWSRQVAKEKGRGKLLATMKCLHGNRTVITFILHPTI